METLQIFRALFVHFLRSSTRKVQTNTERIFEVMTLIIDNSYSLIRDPPDGLFAQPIDRKKKTFFFVRFIGLSHRSLE